MVFILEGRTEDELPENVLGAFRLHALSPNRCRLLPPFVEEREEEGGEGGLE